MRLKYLAIAATLIAAPAWAAPGLWQWQPMDMADMQPMTSRRLSSHLGDWVYAADGSIVGSLQAVNSEQVTIHVSTFFKPNNQPLTLPTRDLGVIHGKLVVHDTNFTQLAP